MSSTYFLIFLFGVVLLITSSFADYQKPHTYSLPTQNDDDGPPLIDDYSKMPNITPVKNPINVPIEIIDPPIIHKP